MSKKLPFLPLAVDAYQHDTSHLSIAEHGAYLLLLMEAWKRPNSSLPDDDKILARLLRISVEEWAELKPSVMEFWTYDGRSKCWHQKRLKDTKVYVQKTRRKKRDAAVSRWEKEKKSNANEYAYGMQSQSQSQRDSLAKKRETVGEERLGKRDTREGLRVVGGDDDV